MCIRAQTGQAGSVLFLILIAVILFAALSYAVTQNTRGGGINPNEEKAELLAAEILNYVTTLQTTITRLQISNGCENEELSIDGMYVYSNGQTTIINPNAPMDKSCHIFHVDGGNIGNNFPWKVLDKDPSFGAKRLQINGSGRVDGIGITDNSGPVSESEADLIFAATSVKKDVCLAINEMLDIENDGNSPPTNHRSLYNLFNGTYGGQWDVVGSGENGGTFPSGNLQGCFQSVTNSNLRFFYSVLIAR